MRHELPGSATGTRGLETTADTCAPTALADEIDTAIAGAVKGLRAHGYSWAEIGSRLGITRQAAQQVGGILIETGEGLQARFGPVMQRVLAARSQRSSRTFGAN